MAQIRIYALAPSIARHRDAMSGAIHAAIVSALDYPEDKKFQRFIALDEGDFIFPADRGEDYTIIEISMFEGRSADAKRALIRALFAYIERDCGIAPHSVEITIQESPKANWGIRGLCADELALGYKVEV